MSWLGRLREDQRKGHWSDWLEALPGVGVFAGMVRGFLLIFKGDGK